MKILKNGIFWCILLLVVTKYSFAIDQKCIYCGKIFKVLGRHVWRCTAKFETDILCNHGDSINPINEMNIPSNSIANNDHVILKNNPEGIITEYDEDIQSEDNHQSNYVKCH